MTNRCMGLDRAGIGGLDIVHLDKIGGLDIVHFAKLPVNSHRHFANRCRIANLVTTPTQAGPCWLPALQPSQGALIEHTIDYSRLNCVGALHDVFSA